MTIFTSFSWQCINGTIDKYPFIYYVVHSILWTLAVGIMIILCLGLDFMSNNFPTRSKAVNEGSFNWDYLINKENYGDMSRLVLSLSIVTFIFKSTLIYLGKIDSWVVFIWMINAIFLIHNCFNKLGLVKLHEFKKTHKSSFNKYKDNSKGNKNNLTYAESLWDYTCSMMFYFAYYFIYKLRKASDYIFWFVVIYIITVFVVTNL